MSNDKARDRKPKGRRNFIREWRKFRGLKQHELAELTGMTPGNLSNIESRVQDYTRTTLESLADALNCEPADLLSRDPNKDEDILDIWRRADPQQRAALVEIAKAVLGAGIRKPE